MTKRLAFGLLTVCFIAIGTAACWYRSSGLPTEPKAEPQAANNTAAVASPLTDDQQILKAVYGTVHAQEAVVDWIPASSGVEQLKDIDLPVNEPVSMKVFQKLTVGTGDSQQIFAITANKPKFECHACTAVMGVALFSRVNGTLQLEAARPFLGEFGNWGKPEEAEPLLVGPSRYGLLFQPTTSGQGYSYESWILVVPHEKTFVRLDIDDTAHDNGGTCTERNDDGTPKKDDDEEDLGPCYGYVSTLHLVRGQHPVYDDVIVTTKGTNSEDSSNVVAPVARKRIFVFDGKGYRLKSDEKTAEAPNNGVRHAKPIGGPSMCRLVLITMVIGLALSQNTGFAAPSVLAFVQKYKGLYASEISDDDPFSQSFTTRINIPSHNFQSEYDD